MKKLFVISLLQLLIFSSLALAVTLTMSIEVIPCNPSIEATAPTTLFLAARLVSDPSSEARNVAVFNKYSRGPARCYYAGNYDSRFLPVGLTPLGAIHTKPARLWPIRSAPCTHVNIMVPMVPNRP
jgi:hypothetical protein